MAKEWRPLHGAGYCSSRIAITRTVQSPDDRSGDRGLIGPALYRFLHRLDLFLPKARANRHKNHPPDSVGVPGRIEQRDKTPVRVAKQVHSIELKVVLELTEIGDVIVERVRIS